MERSVVVAVDSTCDPRKPSAGSSRAARCRPRERSSLVMLPESCGFWPQAGNLRFPALTKDASRLSNHALCSLRSLQCPRAAPPRERAEGPAVPRGRRAMPDCLRDLHPSLSSAHSADCPREPTAPSLLTSPSFPEPPAPCGVPPNPIGRRADRGPVPGESNCLTNGS